MFLLSRRCTRCAGLDVGTCQPEDRRYKSEQRRVLSSARIQLSERRLLRKLALRFTQRSHRCSQRSQKVLSARSVHFFSVPSV
jgi:hypothetical protein